MRASSPPLMEAGSRIQVRAMWLSFVFAALLLAVKFAATASEPCIVYACL
jgi:hypothetical protein